MKTKRNTINDMTFKQKYSIQNKKNWNKKINLFLVLFTTLVLISSCKSDIESIDDLKEVSFEQNPVIINGFRLGIQPDSIGFRLRYYHLDLSPRYINVYCFECQKWRNERSLCYDDKHSWRYILYNEGFGPDYLRLYSKSDPEIIKTKDPKIYYKLEDGKYIRNIITDNFVYADEYGNSFAQKEPIAYFKHVDGIYNMWGSKNLPEGIYADCFIHADFGKDTILTGFEMNFKSENNPPIARLFYNGEEGVSKYSKGDIVDFSDKKFDELYSYDSQKSYIAALNEKEVKEIIKYFEKKFGAKKYDSKSHSGNFERQVNKSFYREYRWSVGIVNIILTIDDLPPVNFITTSNINPYNEFGVGYSVFAKFELNDKIVEIIKKEN